MTTIVRPHPAWRRLQGALFLACAVALASPLRAEQLETIAWFTELGGDRTTISKDGKVVVTEINGNIDIELSLQEGEVRWFHFSNPYGLNSSENEDIVGSYGASNWVAETTFSDGGGRVDTEISVNTEEGEVKGPHYDDIAYPENPFSSVAFQVDSADSAWVRVSGYKDRAAARFRLRIRPTDSDALPLSWVEVWPDPLPSSEWQGSIGDGEERWFWFSIPEPGEWVFETEVTPYYPFSHNDNTVLELYTLSKFDNGRRKMFVDSNDDIDPYGDQPNFASRVFGEFRSSGVVVLLRVHGISYSPVVDTVIRARRISGGG